MAVLPLPGRWGVMPNVCEACGTVRPLESDSKRHERVRVDGRPYIRCLREGNLGVELDER